jgi:arsenical pump membrane protein
MPALPRWLLAFTIPSLLSIAATFAMLALISRSDLRGSITSGVEIAELHAGGGIALGGIGLTAIALVTASAFDAPLGATTCLCGVIVLAVAGLRDRAAVGAVVRSAAWTVLLLVAGLFVLVQGLEGTGLLSLTRQGLKTISAWPSAPASLAVAAIAAAASNLLNNLPSGLIAGASAATLHGHAALRAAIAIGIDLGPNLSVTGSLATVLWLIALRREQIEVTAGTFLRAGAVVMPPALVLAVLGILLTLRN